MLSRSNRNEKKYTKSPGLQTGCKITPSVLPQKEIQIMSDDEMHKTKHTPRNEPRPMAAFFNLFMRYFYGFSSVRAGKCTWCAREVVRTLSRKQTRVVAREAGGMPALHSAHTCTHSFVLDTRLTHDG